MLREAGLDPSRLKFGFGTGTISVSGEIADEADRKKILDVLAGAAGISAVQDNMVVAAPAPAQAPEPPPAPEAPAAEAASEDAGEGSEAEAPKTYTVQSGDTLWKISEEIYGNGSKYMKIFEANTDLLENPDRIFPGQKLVIPELEG
ncbi:MAG: LysM peptidoglycan-binding domain-containing protein [Xanthomonadales bacterium]|nr:LysM peptidoglycan-binding domain-containing protein [Gammaproteobacteria bacterium]MBT8053481.1 LysM peptidoglycan-binding domain-containing protein [Gammaproteobacteria bacterium]NND55849.1 LysM peptidoglycan-binding domain-containing protein [Xanthomonadales bacterium]NNK50931.1 LysM peptidoglycan-binding domain-containing protein [Xanthomonadales bacterium]